MESKPCTGASVADEFINNPAWKVRGISRDPSKPSSKEWSEKGVEMTAGNLDDMGSLQKAFEGANVIFGVTDFWQGFFDPNVQKTAVETGKTVNELCYEMEVRQAKNLVDAVYSTIDTLDMFVFSAINSATQWSKGEEKTVYHFDAKWEAVEYVKFAYPRLHEKTSLYQPAMYLTNWKNGGVTGPQRQPDGSYIIRLPTSPYSKTPMIDPRADTGKCVKALVLTSPGKNLAGAASVLSWTEYTELWGKVMGVVCTFQQVGDDVLPRLIPGGIGQELGDMIRYIDHFGYYGNDDPTMIWPKDLGIEGSLLDVENYIKQADWREITK
ncbi:hypothetical protein EG327_002821 [Venturia inaequalis]|uniref:NmrA-like domain-containing protein n=1 Tax=Venturia inaequalis TaxID=5025 RepID=A0A8H3VM40_VENIN|nr:hypothetical protein EG327_002821 [Venturia inaequalis]